MAYQSALWRRRDFGRLALAVLAATVPLAGCAPADSAVANGGPTGSGSTRRALAVESFLADIAGNVAGDRTPVDFLIPNGVDPHGFEPTPRDVAKIAASHLLIINGAGFEEFIEKTLKAVEGDRLVIEASAGLESREVPTTVSAATDEHGHEGDPHFWLDPTKAVHYVGNIRDGLTKVDPEGAGAYRQNADAYVAKLTELDAWIAAQVATIPAGQRLLVTNHESFGYFADRYGFEVVGAVIPSVSSGASPSAKEMAALVGHIRASKARAIFLETGANPQLAEQIARECGVAVVTNLYTHSLTDAAGPAPTYVEMMRHNARTIVAALK